MVVLDSNDTLTLYDMSPYILESTKYQPRKLDIIKIGFHQAISTIAFSDDEEYLAIATKNSQIAIAHIKSLDYFFSTEDSITDLLK